MGPIAIFPVMSGRSGGGPETYERELVHALAALDAETRYQVLCLTEAAARTLRPDAPNFEQHILPGRIRPIAMSAGLNWALRRHGARLMHAAYIAPPFCIRPYVFTLHCSSPFVHPEWFPPAIRARLLFLFRQGMRHARHVICVSQDVKDRAVEHYRVDPDRLSVIHHGVGRRFAPVPLDEARPLLARHGLEPRGYVFCAARFEKRKNLDRILHAFARYRAEVDPEATLALAGDMTWERPRLEATIAALGLGPAIRQLGYVANADMPVFYSHCRFFAFPSLWEGFGFPVLEAMACGAPVLTSRVSSLPEIAGDAALMVAPTSVDDIAGAMERLGRDDALRDRLRAAGLARAATFGWERCAAATLALYRRLAP